MKISMRVLSYILIGVIFFSVSNVNSQNKTDKSNENTIYVGSYTQKEGHVDGKAEGIYSILQNKKNGSLSPGKTLAEITNPSFVKLSNDGKNLYAVSELGGTSGYIYSYRVNGDKSLTEIGKLSTESIAPCHIAIDKTGKYVFVSNYIGGVVMMYKKNADGVLKKQQHLDIENPEKAHSHSVSISSNNKHTYIADLGNDKIWIYDLDAEKGRLTPNKQKFAKLAKGAGPRHFTFSKNNHFAYSINELNSTINVFKIGDNGELDIVQTISTLPTDFKGKNSGADIHIHPSGAFLYSSNRGHNSIAGFKVDQKTGKLTIIGFTDTMGATPRNFGISPEGNYLYAANQDSSNISIFKIDEETGVLTSTTAPLNAKTPVCLEFE
ncbi:lactonase family protein [Gillisia sp. M10.2A]|uniref:Lactonase family protein n=1 Tax=Gillisia lutea TaxID=2909668 RepID=A0ABS9EIN4_9FLAO|nr:lactonase family protein [Gillisia lutea]MCF4101655.1 lactonase family protein [Gillisia lutea]